MFILSKIQKKDSEHKIHAKRGNMRYNYLMDEAALSSLEKMISQIPSSALWITLAIFVGLSLIFSLALVFHWKKYTLHSSAGRLVQAVYFVGLIILFILCGVSLAVFSAQ